MLPPPPPPPFGTLDIIVDWGWMGSQLKRNCDDLDVFGEQAVVYAFKQLLLTYDIDQMASIDVSDLLGCGCSTPNLCTKRERERNHKGLVLPVS